MSGSEKKPGLSSVELFGVFIDIEAEARKATTRESLFQVIANQPRRLLHCDQIVVVAAASRAAFRVKAASNILKVEAYAPFVQWLEAALSGLKGLEEARAIVRGDIARQSSKDWDEWCPNSVQWIPVRSPDGFLLGGMWLARAEPWKPAEITLLEKLADCFGHAWVTVGRGVTRKHLGRGRGVRHPIVKVTAVCAILAGILAIPVRQSVVAPAEVVAARPHIVAAPLDGVIREIHVEPNEAVEIGASLFSFEDTALLAAVEFAEEGLSVTEAELERALQAGFQDAASGAEVEVLSKRLALRRVELEYQRESLRRATVRAPMAGIALFTTRQDWIGRPVQTGQKVMTVADPSNVALQIELPMDDVIQMPDNAAVTVFLSVNPLSPISGQIVRMSYQPRETDRGTLAFHIDADLETEEPPRIGSRGTARIYGFTVPLALYVFRRPIVALRQMTGL